MNIFHIFELVVMLVLFGAIIGTRLFLKRKLDAIDGCGEVKTKKEKDVIEL